MVPTAIITREMETITTVEDVRLAGRPMKTVSEEQLSAFINEAENLYIKPLLSEKLYNDILSKGVALEPYRTLYEGGVYNSTDGEQVSFMGLRVAISYYVYAQNIMSGDFQATRYGMVIKDNDYSQPLSDKSRSAAYNNALEIASAYMQDCLSYCRAMGLLDSTRRKTRSSGSVRIRKIG